MNNGNGQNGNGHEPQKRGPKPKIGDKQRTEAIAIVKAGGSLNDAADIIGVARDTLNRHLRDNPKFRKGIDRAAASGKIRLVKKVGKSRPWQAAAWMLERKWGDEFGKRVDVQHDGGLRVEVVYRNREPVGASEGNDLLDSPAANHFLSRTNRIEK
jgi:hypothetical protein